MPKKTYLKADYIMKLKSILNLFLIVPIFVMQSCVVSENPGTAENSSSSKSASNRELPPSYNQTLPVSSKDISSVVQEFGSFDKVTVISNSSAVTYTSDELQNNNNIVSVFASLPGGIYKFIVYSGDSTKTLVKKL